MTKCQETGCNEQASHRYRSPSGFRVPLCETCYKKWGKYEDKRSPLTLLVNIGKFLIRFTGVLMLLFGVLTVGLAVNSFIHGTELSYNIALGLIFTELHLYLQDTLSISLAGAAILLAGVALFYVGFMKMEHDLW